MWGPPGTAYVYFTYGNHYCVNVVTEPEGTAGAVLLRALEPVEGLDLMRANRRGRPERNLPGALSRGRRGKDDRLLTAGPGRLTAAMRVGPEYNGIDLTRPPLYIARGRTRPVSVATSSRIGIRVATDRLWRFYIPGNPFVSR